MSTNIAAEKKNIVLKLEQEEKIDASALDKWSELINGAAESIDKIVFDFTMHQEVHRDQISALSRHIGAIAKKNNWPISVLCSAKTEKIFADLGLNELFKCFQVHQKATASQVLSSSASASDASGSLRNEMSTFFGYLAPSLEKVMDSLFGMSYAYAPPLKLLTDLSSEFSSDNEVVVSRMESAAMSYRLFLFVKTADKAKMASAMFKGQPVSDEVMHDLLAELTNNIVGDLVSQLARADYKVKIKAQIPEVLPLKQQPSAQDLQVMKAKASLQFKSADSELSIVVGYGPKC